MTSYMELMGLDRPDLESVSEVILEPPRALFDEVSRARIRAKLNIGDSNLIKGCIGICAEGDHSGRIVLPSFDSFGRLNFFVTRSFEDFGAYKYLNCSRQPRSIIFNEIFIDWSKPIVLTESVKTHFKMIDYVNFVPLLGTSLNKRSKLLDEMILNGATDVTLMFDKDAASKQLECARTLLGYGFNVSIVDDLKGEDQPDKLNCDDIIECVSKAKPISRKLITRMRIASKI